MAWFTRSSNLKTLAVALTLGLAVTLPVRGQAQLSSRSPSSDLPDRWELRQTTTSSTPTLSNTSAFRPPRSPDAPRPENRAGGGTRGGDRCSADEGIPIALVPESLVGTTTAEYPTIYWYMPSTSAPAVQFVLRDAGGDRVYEVQYSLSDSAEETAASGIMSITLPAFANLSPLEVGEVYSWELALKCDPPDSSQDIVVQGKIQRVAVEPETKRQLQQATPQERLTLYAGKRLWYDTLDTLIELRRDRPEDTDLAAAWDKLLTSVGL